MLWSAPGTAVVEMPIFPHVDQCFAHMVCAVAPQLKCFCFKCGHLSPPPSDSTQAYSLDLEYWLLPEVTGMYYGVYELTEASIRQVRPVAEARVIGSRLQIVDTVAAAMAKQVEASAQCAGGVCQ